MFLFLPFVLGLLCPNPVLSLFSFLSQPPHISFAYIMALLRILGTGLFLFFIMPFLYVYDGTKKLFVFFIVTHKVPDFSHKWLVSQVSRIWRLRFLPLRIYLLYFSNLRCMMYDKREREKGDEVKHGEVLTRVVDKQSEKVCCCVVLLVVCLYKRKKF